MPRPAAVLTFVLAVILPYTAAVVADPTEPWRGDHRGDRIIGKPWAWRSAGFGCNGMTATSQPLASQIAIDILKAGGSATHGPMTGPERCAMP